MLKCKSRIQREFKTRKADSFWPEMIDGKPTPAAEKLKEECNGEITIELKLEQEPYYGGYDTVLVVEITCSRCKYPWVKGWPEFRHKVAMGQKLDVSELLNDQ